MLFRCSLQLEFGKPESYHIIGAIRKSQVDILFPKLKCRRRFTSNYMLNFLFKTSYTLKNLVIQLTFFGVLNGDIQNSNHLTPTINILLKKNYHAHFVVRGSIIQLNVTHYSPPPVPPPPTPNNFLKL